MKRQNQALVFLLVLFHSQRISHEEDEHHCHLSSDEKELLLSIKNVNITVPPERMNQALFSLVDILCAYCYDVRMTQQDPTPESAWTISILSPTLSWLVPSSSLRNTLIAFIRRVMIYPYLRRYDLARLCVKDCIVILKLGKRRLLKCLLEVIVRNLCDVQIKKIMKFSERKYILNTLYIDKYILWIQVSYNFQDSNLQNLEYPILFDVAEEVSVWFEVALLYSICCQRRSQEKLSILAFPNQKKKEENSFKMKQNNYRPCFF